jgi:3-isopropylmalate dehydratase small subunit
MKKYLLLVALPLLSGLVVKSFVAWLRKKNEYEKTIAKKYSKLSNAPDFVRNIIQGLVLQAEATFKSGEGKKKFKHVVELAKKIIPDMYLKDQDVEKLAQAVFDETAGIISDLSKIKI